MAAPKKPVAKPVVKKAPAKKAMPSAGVPTWYNEKGKPDPNGLYNRDGMMGRTSAARPGVKKAPAGRSEEEKAIARKNGYLQ